MSDEFMILIKHPGTAWELRTIENTNNAIQEAIGGYMEIAAEDKFGNVLVCNEEGAITQLPANNVYGALLFGTVFICGTDDEGNFCDISTPASIDDTVRRLIEAGYLPRYQ